MWLCSICSFKGGCDGGVVVCSVLFFNIWCKGVGVGVVGDLEGLSIESLSDSSPSLFCDISNVSSICCIRSSFFSNL
ncbi:Uncharacterised protein [Chlamydia trachomatis]|nr:Uncharacterised protein [Chlamydia trachomatis]